jgi:hypothetical protein
LCDWLLSFSIESDSEPYRAFGSRKISMRKSRKNNKLPLDFRLPDGTTVRSSVEARIAATPLLDGPDGVTRRGLLARDAGLRFYDEYCDAHGVTQFDSTVMRCALCRPVTLGELTRTEARKAGEKTYLDVCPEHGETAHGVQYGKCLTCFNTAGARRSVRELIEEPRARARRDGLPSFLDECREHGRTAHSVSHGKCLSCFTTAGVARGGRPGRSLTGGARAVARRDGEKTYRDVCPEHGETDHSVAHGKCLMCFTTAGVRRAGA